MPVEVGSVLQGVVKNIANFGAFVELPGGEVGLVHISEIADTYVRDIHDYLREKDRVAVKVISVDEAGRIRLSVRQATGKSAEARRAARMSFEDKLAKFMKESEERQQDLRRSTESKRGGRGASRKG